LKSLENKVVFPGKSWKTIVKFLYESWSYAICYVDGMITFDMY